MLKQVCIVAVTVMLCITLGEVAYTIHKLRPKVLVTVENIDRATIAAGAAAGDLELGARKWQGASDQQIKAVTQVSSNANAAVEQLTNLISQTDKSLNSSLIPATVTALNQQNAALLTTQEQFRANLTGLQSATDSLKLTLLDVDKQVANPAIANSLSNVEASTLNLNAGIKNLTGVTADAKAAADLELENLKKPEKVWLAILKFVLQYGANARGLFAGY